MLTNFDAAPLFNEQHFIFCRAFAQWLDPRRCKFNSILRLQVLWVVSASCLRSVESTTNGRLAYRFILSNGQGSIYPPPTPPKKTQKLTLLTVMLILFHHLLTISSFFHFGTMVRYLLFYRSFWVFFLGVNYVSFCWNWDSQPQVHLARYLELESCRVKFVLRVKNLFRNKDELNRRKFISQTSMIL